jgi:hypothetical protein
MQIGCLWPPFDKFNAHTLFAWLISHQPTVLFSQNKPANSNQPEPASSTLLSEQTSISYQPPANRTGHDVCNLTPTKKLLTLGMLVRPLPYASSMHII